MTTAEFAARFPKPWRLVRHSVSLSIHAANDSIVGRIYLDSHHKGIPQKEWMRHVIGALSEYLPCTDNPMSASAVLSAAERAISP